VATSRATVPRATINAVPLPEPVTDAITQYLAACDEAVPDLVVGLHVVGSLALGDFRPDRSDIDVVAVVREPPDHAERLALADVHRSCAPTIDGPYLTAAVLAGPPVGVGPVAHHVAGHFALDECHEVSPVTWSILDHDAVTVRGDTPAAMGLRPDPDAVRRFSAANLRTYWTGWAANTASVIAELPGGAPIDARLLEWGVLGAARVQQAATTGEVVSKSAAGAWARSTAGDEWQAVLQLALDARGGSVADVPVTDLRTACAFVASRAASI
jgi:hypothetical protein